MKTDTALQAKDDPEFFERNSESEWAKKNHIPTRILGWALIVGVVLSIVESISGNHFDMGGIVFVIAGFSILGGSQAWLRFVTFITTCGALALPFTIAWSLFKGEPFLIEGSPREWTSWNERSFWIRVVAPGGYFTGLATLGVVCLRTRKLEFWTGAARIWGGIVLAILLLRVVLTIYGEIKELQQGDIRVSHRTELDALRSYVGKHGSWSSSGWSKPVEDILTINPTVQRASLRSSPNSSFQLYKRSGDRSSTGTRVYSEFIKAPSGEWVQIELEVVSADN